MKTYPVIRSSGLALVGLALVLSSGCDDPEQFESAESTEEVDAPALDLTDVAEIECDGDCDVSVVAEGDEPEADEHGPEWKDDPADETNGVVCARLFQHKNYGGSQLAAGPGHYPKLGPWSDEISSLRVRKGCVLRVYEHTKFGGAQWKITGPVPWVGNGWNDRISSFVCSC